MLSEAHRRAGLFCLTNRSLPAATDPTLPLHAYTGHADVTTALLWTGNVIYFERPIEIVPERSCRFGGQQWKAIGGRQAGSSHSGRWCQSQLWVAV